MKLIVLGSSSKGNSYILRSAGGDSLIIEAGISISAVYKYVRHDDISGVLVSHSHGDHAGRVQEYLDAYIPVHMNNECIHAGRIKPYHNNPKLFSEESSFHVGRFDVIAFRLFHDVPCSGFLIRHPDMSGNLLFCTDTSKIPYTFDGVENLLVEADYDESLLARNQDNGAVHPVLASRIRKTHFSIDKAIQFCTNRNLKEVRNIILIHLSEKNSDAECFRQRMVSETGKMVYVASAGLEVEVGNKPF